MAPAEVDVQITLVIELFIGGIEWTDTVDIAATTVHPHGIIPVVLIESFDNDAIAVELANEIDIFETEVAQAAADLPIGQADGGELLALLFGTEGLYLGTTATCSEVEFKPEALRPRGGCRADGERTNDDCTKAIE